MPPGPEDIAREQIDPAIGVTGAVQDVGNVPQIVIGPIMK
jgi:hypothetical protein